MAGGGDRKHNRNKKSAANAAYKAESRDQINKARRMIRLIVAERKKGKGENKQLVQCLKRLPVLAVRAAAQRQKYGDKWQELIA